MDVPVVLSHRTAWLFYHAAQREGIIARGAEYGIDQLGIKASEVARRVRVFLTDCGIPADELDTLHVLVAFSHERGGSKAFRTHVRGALLTENHLVHVAPGLFVVSPEVAFIQASLWMKPLELLEWGGELCGHYETCPWTTEQGTRSGNTHVAARTDRSATDKKDGRNREADQTHDLGYRERPALASRTSIQSVAQELSGVKGARKAQRALRRVRDGARSPMETALALMIMCPIEDGGLGFTNIELGHRMNMPPNLQPMFSSSYLELDLYFPSRKVALEYDGAKHAELNRRTHDSDRAHALALMGISMRTITAHHFANQLELHRALNAVAVMLGIVVPMSRDFQRKQNKLRQFLIRHWGK